MSALTQASGTPPPQPVPPGQLLVSLRWQRSELAAVLRRGPLRPAFSDRLGVADFLPAADTAALLLTERDLMAAHVCRRRIAKLARSTIRHKVVIMERTSVTSAEFESVQLEAALDLQLSVLPVSSVSELPQLLAELASAADRSAPDPLSGRPPDEPPPREMVRAALRNVPGLGQTKVDALLAEFGSLRALSQASVEQLTAVLGYNLAVSVHEFFNG